MRVNRFLVLAIIAAIAGTLAFQRFYLIKDTHTLAMDLMVGEKVGFNLNNDSIHFGTTYKGGGSRRSIVVENTYSIPLKVSIELYGNISGFVSVSENDFVLLPGAREPVTFFAQTPPEVGYGNYTGTAKLGFYRII